MYMVLDPQLVREEKIRYSILLLVYERSDQNCEVVITGSEIGAELSLSYEDLYGRLNS